MNLKIVTLLLLFSFYVYSETYSDSNISFKYPTEVGFFTSVSDRYSSKGDNPKMINLTLIKIALPLEYSSPMGFTNDNIDLVKLGLHQGEIKGYPFHSKEFVEVLQTEDGEYILKNYGISYHALLDFTLTIEYFILFDDIVYRISVDARESEDYIQKNFPEFISIELGNLIQWKDIEAIIQFGQFVSTSNDPILQNWSETLEMVLKSLQLHRN